MPHLLLLVSSASELTLADGSTHPTGCFAATAVTPYERFIEAGVAVVVATADGRSPLADPYGLEPFFHYPDKDEQFLASVTRTFAHDVDDIRLTLRHLTELDLASARRVFLALRERGLEDARARELISEAARIAWVADRRFPEVLEEEHLAGPLAKIDVEHAVAALKADARAASDRIAARLTELPGFQHPVNLAKLSDMRFAEFDAVFVPDGYGPMVDLADNPDVGRVLRVLHEKNAPIASLGHGPAFLLSAPATSEGQWLFDGYRMTSFTNEEEAQTPLGKAGPQWWLETALKSAGAVFEDSLAAWTSHVVVDRNLITAQNPCSTNAAADVVLKALEGPERAWRNGHQDIVHVRPRARGPALCEVSSAAGDATASREPERIAREFLAAFAAGDVEKAMALLAPHARVEIPPAGVLGTAEQHGREFIVATVTAFPDLRLTVRKSFSGTDGTVVAEVTMEGTQAANYLGIINQRKHLDMDQVWVLTVSEGQITEIKAFWCQNQLYRRLAVKRLDQLSIV